MMTIGVVMRLRSDLRLKSFLLPQAKQKISPWSIPNKTLKQQHSGKTEKNQKLESYFCNYYIHQHPPKED